MSASTSGPLTSVIQEIQTFDPEKAAEYEKAFKKGGLLFLNKKIEEDMNEWRKVPVNIGVTGSSGVGKSTFINTIRGLKASSEGAAAVGVTETTMVPTKYMHPDNNSIALWDLPGMGSQKFPKEEYLKEVGFEKYDFFLIITTTRFTENDIWLGMEAQNRKKKFYFIRGKMDIDVESNRRDFQKKGHETTNEIREVMTEQVTTANFQNVKVYLIDNSSERDYDFPNLVETMIEEAPAFQKEAMALSLKALTDDLIIRKRSALRKRIMLAALLSAGGGAVPLPGLSFVIDKAIVMREVHFYKQQFGLDDESLQKMSIKLDIALKQLKGTLKTTVSAIQLATNASVLLGASEIAEKFTAFVIPVLGCIVAGGLSYGSTAYVLWSLLDICVADAQTINKQLTQRYTNQDVQQQASHIQ